MILKRNTTFTLAIAIFVVIVVTKFLTAPKGQTFFRDPLTARESMLLEELLRVTDVVLRQANVMYWMVDGALIGSYRHHNRIPWDDDADIIVDKSQRAKITELLKNYSPDEFGVLTKKVTYDSVKFYSMMGRDIEGEVHKAPYVDIYFYEETKDMFLRTDPKLRSYSMLKKHVLPLILRPYGSLWLPAPCNVPAVLTPYNITMCILPDYNHLKEKPTTRNKSAVYTCESLRRELTWVDRKTVSLDEWMKSDQEERLMIGDEEVREVIIQGVCAVTHT